MDKRLKAYLGDMTATQHSIQHANLDKLLNRMDAISRFFGGVVSKVTFPDHRLAAGTGSLWRKKRHWKLREKDDSKRNTQQQPCNLDNTNPWQGLVVNPAEPRFATFKDPTRRVSERWPSRSSLTTTSAKDGSRIDTIREVIERWAPPSETTLRRIFKPSRKR